MITLAPISLPMAKQYFLEHSAYRGDFTLAIAACEFGQGDDVSVTMHGVIALRADGSEFALGHIHTDGNAQIGSLLYGAAWRVAKALGYKAITI